jgi:PIN domain nuclease of toxin-antitoxin system
MRLLLDTHIALWAIRDDAQLSARARGLIVDPDNAILVSAATVWEISVKHTLKRADMPLSGADAVGFFREAGYELISVSATHAALAGALPPYHADPFDRMLVAQARAESAQLLTHDGVITKYGSWVIHV